MKLITHLMLRLGCGFVLLLLLARADAAEKQLLHGHVPAVVPRLQSIGRLNPTRRLDLAIGLPLRNREALTTLLEQLYNPASTNFHRFLTPAQFTERFGPTVEDYQAAMDFAKSNRLAITGTYANRRLLDVSGVVTDVESAFHVTLRTYHHPREARDFYAPDTEPWVDLEPPLLEINGLNNYYLGHPMARAVPDSGSAGADGGSGPLGYYRGLDFRNAYVPGRPFGWLRANGRPGRV